MKIIDVVKVGIELFHTNHYYYEETNCTTG